MLLEDISLRFRDFNPSAYARRHLDLLAKQLLMESPSEAILDADFARTGNEFEGVIDIRSTSGRFYAKASDKKIQNVASNLKEQIRKQIQRWRTERFDAPQQQPGGVGEQGNTH